MGVGGGVGAAAGGGGATFVFDLKPGVAQGFGEVVVHGAGDGDGVGGGGGGGSGFGLFVVLAQAAAEVLLNDRVAHRVRVDSPVVVAEVGAAVVRHRTVGQVTVSVVRWGTCDH